MKTLNSTFGRMSSLAALTMLVGAAGVANAAAFHQAGIADMYQHQKSFQGEYPKPGAVPPVVFATDPKPAPLAAGYSNANWWEPDGGWCLTTAWVDTLYYWGQKGYTKLWDHSNLGAAHQGKNWQERFAYVNEDLAIIAATRAGVAATDGGSCAYPVDVKKYADNYGLTATIDTYQIQAGKVAYFPDSAAGGHFLDPSVTLLAVADEAIRAGKTVILYMEGVVPGAWWSGSFHAVALEGVDLATREVWFADPNDTQYGKNWGFGYKAGDNVPVGADATFGSATLKADGRTWDGGSFAGSSLTNLFIMSCSSLK